MKIENEYDVERLIKTICAFISIIGAIVIFVAFILLKGRESYKFYVFSSVTGVVFGYILSQIRNMSKSQASLRVRKIRSYSFLSLFLIILGVLCSKLMFPSYDNVYIKYAQRVYDVETLHGGMEASLLCVVIEQTDSNNVTKLADYEGDSAYLKTLVQLNNEVYDGNCINRSNSVTKNNAYVPMLEAAARVSARQRTCLTFVVGYIVYAVFSLVVSLLVICRTIWYLKFVEAKEEKESMRK